MRISLERSGGFISIPLTTTIDTAYLNPVETEQLRQILATINFSQLSGYYRPAGQGDRIQYRLTLETSGQSETLAFGESTMPSALQPLIEWLQQSARR